MDFTSFWFLLIMVVVGGVIAVLADNLGRKLGKSRLRVGKLRPRHTAMLFTAITGAVVTLITILLVATLSAEVRQWIIDGREAVKKSQVLISQYGDLKTQFQSTLGQLNEANTELTKRKNEIDRLQKDLEKNKSAAKVFENRADSAEKQASAADRRLSEREKALKELSGNLSKAKAKLDEVNNTYAKLNETYAKLGDNFKKLDASYKNLDKQTKASYEQNRTLQNQNIELEGSNKQLLNDIESLNKQLNQGKADLTGLLSEIKSQEARYQTISSLFQTTFSSMRGSRLQPVVYSIGDEVVRREVGLALTLADAEDKIRATLGTAAESIYKKTNMEMGLMDVLQEKFPSPDAMVSKLSRELLDARGPSIITVSVPVNIFGDEPVVPVAVTVQANPIVFKKGELLGEARLDGTESVDEIIDRISSMLRTQVRAKAIQAKMLGGGEGDELGTVKPAEVVKLVSAIDALNRPVRVQALAKADTRVSGPLEIEFRVR